MSRVAIGALVGVVAAATLGACTVNLDNKTFCEPHCSGGGGATSSSSTQGGGGGDGGTGGTAGSGGTGTAGSMNGGGGGCPGTPSTPVNDTFDDQGKPPADFWHLFFDTRSKPEMVQDKGELVITPTGMATWYTGAGACPKNDCGAPAAVQRLAGNFAVKVHVRVVPTGDPEGNDFEAAGILLAEPCHETENNIVWDVGYQANGMMTTDLYQTKGGVAGMPDLGGTGGSLETELYACRIGTDYYFYAAAQAGQVPDAMKPDKKLLGESDGELHVGPTAHANGKPVIEARFASVTFAVPKSQRDCTSGL